MDLLERLKAQASKTTETKPDESTGSDLLERMKNAGGEVEQCGCGSHLEGECDECEDPVNPPPPEPEPEKNECPTCGKSFKHLSRHKCKGAVETPPETPPQEKPEAKDADTDMSNTERSEKRGFVLLIDCLYEAAEEDVEIVYLGDIVAPMGEAVAKENKVVHWQVVEYARGPGFLAAKLEEYLVSTGVDGVMYLDSMTPEGKACKETLRRHARAVIQGVR